MKTILELSHTEARQFFLKQESYCTVELPPYFAFQNLLTKLSDFLNNENIDKKFSLKAKDRDDANYTFFTNKDGKFAWRPLQLINPAIYVYLVHKMTEEKNWNDIKKRFEKLQSNKKITCCSIPSVSEDDKKSDKGEGVTNWWQSIEQRSLELALDYDCFLNTDITDCYGSIYTHTIAWAISGKDEAKKNRRNDSLGNCIDSTIQAMQYGQTNGIPQGSVLMDFIAEMVLGYADCELTKKIKKYNENEGKYKIDDYKILRYRDDYRIFAENQETVVKIAKLLTETLIGLSLRLNTQKTFISDNIIRDSRKPDKLYWNKAKQGETTLQKHLFLIHSLAEEHPNSGSLKKALDKFLNRVYRLKSFKEGNMKVLVSILVDIAFNNPGTYPVITAILSKLLSMGVEHDAVNEILKSIENKFEKIPNVGHLQVWLQRLTYKTNPNKPYEERLCKKVIDDNEQIWNIDWLDKDIQNIFTKQQIIDRQKIEEMPQIIEPKEVKLYGY